MVEQVPICDCAKGDLIFTGEGGNQDVFLWEHCRRVAQNARQIAKLPGVPRRKLDYDALEAAAFYHEAGWVQQVCQGTVHRLEVLCGPTSELQRELGAVMLTKSLAGRLKPRSLEAAAMLVRQLNDRHKRALEARILADADNLDEIGSLLLWNMIRRHSFEGKGIEATLQTWKRQREFHFWEARINKSVHFEAVKQIAFQRLEQLDQLMSVLAQHHTGDDLRKLLENPESTP